MLRLLNPAIAFPFFMNCPFTHKPLTIPLFLHNCFTSTNRICGPMEEESNQEQESTVAKATEKEYPKPLSPPPPEHSRDIEFQRAMRAEAAVKAGPALTKKEIIYEDEWMIAVNKPAGVYCEHVLSSIPELLASTGLGISIGWISFSTEKGTKNDANSLELHLANRLDRDTSGVMVITKSHRIAGKLVKAFTDRKVRKTYLALCIGPIPKWSEIYIESGHGRSKFGAWRVYSRKDVGKILPGGSVIREMATCMKVLSVNGIQKIQDKSSKESESSFSQVTFDLGENPFFTCEDDRLTDGMEKIVVTEQNSENIGRESGDVNSPDVRKNAEVLIRAYPQSGRTHQIRLHCQYLGLPIRGDVKYEGPHVWKGITYAKHALHAESLCFEHPVTHIMVKLHASIPQWAMEAYSYTSS